MKLIFTYDSTDLKEIGRLTAYDKNVVEEKHVLTIDKNEKDDVGEPEARNLYDVAKDIKNLIEEIKDDTPCIIFINQYLICADEGFQWLQCNAGIALIKFLRMMEVRDHIVLITPYKKAEVVRENPANVIVTSKGVTCAKYLHKFLKKSFPKLETLAKEKFDEKQDLKPYLKVDFELPQDERHNWANWWGIDRLWQVHIKVDYFRYGSKERWELEEYPLKKVLKELKNNKALFLYEHDNVIVRDYLKSLSKSILKSRKQITSYETALTTIERRIDEISNSMREGKLQKNKLKNKIRKIRSKNGLPNHIHLQLNEYIPKLIEIIARNPKLAQKFSELRIQEQKIREALTELLRTHDYRLENLTKEEQEVITGTTEVLKKIEEAIQSEKSRIHSLSIKELRSKLREISPHILYIDDQAHEGWSDIFQRIIYGSIQDKTDTFKTIPEPYSDLKVAELSPEEIYNHIKSKITETQNRTQIILLDLRLKKERGTRFDVENLSGAVVLKMIRNDTKSSFHDTPVIITTASNKSWSYRGLMKMEANAYWTKEGLDVILSEEESVQNYISFLEIIYDTINKYSKSVG